MNQHLNTPSKLDYEPRARRAPVAVPVWLCITLIICGTSLLLGLILTIPWELDLLRVGFVTNLALLAFITALGTAMIVAGYWHARH